MGRPKGAKKVLSGIDLEIKKLQEQRKEERKKEQERKLELKKQKAKEKTDKDAFSFRLIEEVKNHEIIWDKSLEGYRNRNHKDQEWKAIELALDRPAQVLRDSWKNLVDQMRRECENTTVSGNGLDHTKIHTPSWKFYESLTFLKDSNFKFRESQSNFEEISNDNASFNFDDPLDFDNRFDDDDENVEPNDTMNSNSQDSPCTSSSAIPKRIPDPPSAPTSPRVYKNKQSAGRAKKRAATAEVKNDLDNQIGLLTKILTQPDTNANEKFLSYLGDVLVTVPPEKIRRCQKDILVIADAYADGNEKNIQLVIEFNSSEAL